MSHAFINTGCLVMVALVLFWLWRRTRDIWSCANVFSACFGLTVLGSQVWSWLTESPFNPTPETVLLLYTGWIAFLLGVAIMVRRRPPQPLYAPRIIPVNSRLAVPVLVALMVAHLAYSVAVISSTGLVSIFQASQYGAIESLAANRVNSAGNRSLANLGWYLEAWHIAYVYYVPLALYLYRQRQISRKILLFVWCFAGVSSLVLFSRVHLLMLLVFGLVAWIVLFRPSGWKVARRAGALMCAAMALFVGMQTVLSHVDFNNKTLLSDQLATYTFSSALSFQELLNGNYHQANPHHALYVGEGIYYVLGKLSLLNPAEYPIGYKEWVFVPHPSNVYTFLDDFALDFGTVGIILGPFVMGMSMAWVHNRVRTRTTYPLVLLYGLCVYSCAVANLANFLFTPPALIFLGTVFLLGPLVAADARPGALIRPARHPPVSTVPPRV
jgi:oligosaccharide repeat unit polymerase